MGGRREIKYLPRTNRPQRTASDPEGAAVNSSNVCTQIGRLQTVSDPEWAAEILAKNWHEGRQRDTTFIIISPDNHMSTFNSKFSGGINSSPIGSPGGTVLNVLGLKANLRKPLKIGTWNTRSLFEAGKLANLAQEMNRLGLDILGVAETWWPGSGKCGIENGTFFYSGNEDQNHRKGVGFVITKNLVKYVTDFVPYSDRTALIKFQAKPNNLNIIQVYAPTADAADHEVNQFYKEVTDLLKLTKKHDINIVMGDFNAKIGKGSFEGIVGPYGLGTRNERGDRLVQFCQEEDMKITNTWFQLPSRRLYTWKSPADQPQNIIRNQIDFILINKRFSTTVKKACTYPGADVPSDHILLVAVVRIALSCRKKPTTQKRIALDKIDNPTIKIELSNEINTQFQTITPNTKEDLTPTWTMITDTVTNIMKNSLGYEQKNKKQKWMTNEILSLMDERRKHKNYADDTVYKNIQRQIRAKIRIAKNEWLKHECTEIERLQNQHDDRNLHKKLKETAGIYRKWRPTVVVNRDNQIVLDDKEKTNIWEKYIKELFNDDRPLREHKNDDYLNSPSITKEEIKKAIHNSKNNKAPGPDEIPSEILKLLDERGITTLHKIFNIIYETGHYPEQWLCSTFIPLPKKTNARRCEDHRLISLMSHTLKVFLKIIHQRIYRKCERDISDSQFGFRQGLGTREAIVATQVLVQNCYDQRKDVCLCFLDYEKAFDRVQHHKLIQLLRKLDIDQKDIRCIENLYWYQNAQIKVDNNTSNSVQIKRGVRQGCVLSPLLFNIYSEAIFQEALEDIEKGIKVNGVWINNIRYADDAVLVSDNIPDLQQLVTVVGEGSKSMGLNINTAKTKFMVISRNLNAFENSSITFNTKPIERVNKFKYLGAWLFEDWTSDMEVKCRIEQARQAFLKFRKVLTCSDFDLELRLRFTKCYVWSVLLYGVEGWTLKISAINKLEAFEMWLYRRILKIPWTAKMTNEEVLTRVNRERQLFETIKKRKTAYLGHIMRNEKYQFLQLMIEGKIEGKRGIGRKKMSWLRNIRQWTGIHDVQTLIHTARSREAMENVIANIH